MEVAVVQQEELVVRGREVVEQLELAVVGALEPPQPRLKSPIVDGISPQRMSCAFLLAAVM